MAQQQFTSTPIVTPANQTIGQFIVWNTPPFGQGLPIGPPPGATDATSGQPNVAKP
jgi:hypothetical protein